MVIMRNICCLLLVAIATVITASEDITEARSKRDIAFFKNLLTGKLFRSEEVPFAVPEQNYRLFKIPGFKNVLVKAVPKVKVAVEKPPPAEELRIEDVHPSIGLVSSFLGTKTLNETLSALEGMKALLQSGVLSAREGTGFSTYRIPVNISPFSTETFEVIDMDGDRPDCKFPLLHHPVPIPYGPIGNQHKPVKIPLPDSPYPAKYSYNQIHGNGVTTYTSNDDKNVIVTESKYPVHLPEYLNNRFQNVLALGFQPAAVDTNDHYNKYLNRDGSVSIFSGSGVVEKGKSPKPIYPLDPHSHVNVDPSIFTNDYLYKHLHEDGSVSSYSSGSGVVERGKNQNLPLPNYPFIHKPTSVIHIHDPPKVITAPHFPVVPIPTDYSYKHIHKDGSVSTYSGSGVVEEGKRPLLPIHPLIHKPTPVVHIHDPPKVIVAPPLPVAPVPNDYFYKHIHQDGTVSTYSGSGVVEQSQKLPLPIHPLNNKPLPVFNIHDPPRVIVAPNLPLKPMAVENDYTYKHLHQDGSVTSYSGSGVVEQSKSQKLPMSVQPLPSPVINIHELPKVKVPHHPNESPFVTNDYSYKHVHQDGSVTTYSGQGNKFEKPVVPIGSFEPSAHLVPVYEAPHIIESPFIPTKVSAVPTDYSYNHLHNDGSVTTYSGEGMIEKMEVRPAILVEQVKNPAHLPRFLANRIENVAATAYNVPPPLAVVKETVYGPPIPVYQEPHPLLLEHSSSFIPKPSNPSFNDVNTNVGEHHNKAPSRYSYQTVHQGGSSTVQYASGLAQEKNNNDNEKITENTEGHRHHDNVSVMLTNNPTEKVFNAEDLRNSTQLRIDSSQAGGFSFTTVHRDGSTSTYSSSGAKPQNKLPEHIKVPSTRRRKVTKVVRRPSIKSQESPNKNINDHMTNQQIVHTEVDGSKRTGQVNMRGEEDNTTVNKKTENSASIFVDNEHSKMTGSTLRSIAAKTMRPVSEFSFDQATDHGVYINNNGAVDFKSETSLSNYKDKFDITKEHVYTTDSTLTSSAISLNANPIVVLPDEHLFSYKQDKAGSSITVLSDNVDNVRVVEENRTENFETHRGDIPDASY